MVYCYIFHEYILVFRNFGEFFFPVCVWAGINFIFSLFTINRQARITILCTEAKESWPSLGISHHALHQNIRLPCVQPEKQETNSDSSVYRLWAGKRVCLLPMYRPHSQPPWKDITALREISWSLCTGKEIAIHSIHYCGDQLWFLWQVELMQSQSTTCHWACTHSFSITNWLMLG